MGVGEKRGNKPYIPPIDWKGIGLKVLGKYDDGDNTWIGMNNSIGEWYVAYHGVASGQFSNNVKNVTGAIYKGTFKKGNGQAHAKCPDQFHEGKLVGEGVYCLPNIVTAEGYAGISEIKGKSYKTLSYEDYSDNIIIIKYINELYLSLYYFSYLKSWKQ